MFHIETSHLATTTLKLGSEIIFTATCNSRVVESYILITKEREICRFTIKPI